MFVVPLVLCKQSLHCSNNHCQHQPQLKKGRVVHELKLLRSLLNHCICLLVLFAGMWFRHCTWSSMHHWDAEGSRGRSRSGWGWRRCSGETFAYFSHLCHFQQLRSFPASFLFIEHLPRVPLSLSDSEQVRLLDLLPEQCPLLDGFQCGAGLSVLLRMCAVHQWTSGNVSQLSPPAVPGALVPPDLLRKQVQLRRWSAPYQPRPQLRLQNQIHGTLTMPNWDPHAISALAQPADPLEQVLLSRVALQCPLVPQA